MEKLLVWQAVVVKLKQPTRMVEQPPAPLSSIYLEYNPLSITYRAFAYNTGPHMRANIQLRQHYNAELSSVYD